MKNTSLILLTIFITALVSTSCTRYDEGPGFTLRTKNARITGEWEIDKINVNILEEITEENEEMLNDYARYLQDSLVEFSFYLERGGEGWARLPDLDIPEISFPEEVDIEWKFENSYEDLMIQITSSGTHNLSGWLTYNILRLTKDELWLIDENDFEHDVYVEMQFKKQ